MRIAIFSDTYMPHVNGVAISTDILFQELKKASHDVWLFCPTMPGAQKSTDNIFRLKSFKFPFYPGHRMTYQLMGLGGRIKQIKPDIIHSQTPFFVGMAANSIRKKLNIPMVHCYHTLFESYLHYAPILPKDFALSFTEKFGKFYCNQSALVVAPSKGIKDLLLTYGVTSRIEVLPTGIEIDLFRNAHKGEFRKYFNIPQDKKLIIYAGRLGYEKNINFVVKSFEQVLKQLPDVMLAVVGDGPYKKDLERMVYDAGIMKKMVFTGEFSRYEVATAFKDSDIFVFASKTETQGLVILEAMASGLPVVALDAIGVSDVVVDGKTGFLCKDDINEYTQKIVTLLTDEQLRRNLANGAEEHARQYSSENFAAKMVSFYESVLKK